MLDCISGQYIICLTNFIQLNRVLSHLEAYFKRFCNLLGAGNRRYIQTLIVLSKYFIKLLSNSSNNSANGTMTINEFLFSLDIDNINLVKLCQYVKESKIVHKVNKYHRIIFYDFWLAKDLPSLFLLQKTHGFQCQ